MSNQITIIESRNIDKDRWNGLIQKSEASVYNQLYYLDTLSEHWCAVIWGDYKGAIAVPYSVRAGVRGIFTPNFIRALDWMGEVPDNFQEVEKLLKKRFKRADFNTNQSLFSGCEELVYQSIDKTEEIALGSQTKRGIKKFEKAGLTIEKMEIDVVLPLVISELREKVKTLNDSDFKRFKQLLLHYDKKTCVCYGVKTDRVHAGVILIEWNGEVLYIKGGVDEFGKEHGCMHALMSVVIKEAVGAEKTFSFEGSFVPTVRRFNVGFGAKDNIYYSWKWNHAPWWFRLLLKLKKMSS